MKIRQLHINRFGHFNECDLVFPGDGLQVIYGPNEAGKTTLLEFLRGLLFDFPARTPYDFGGQGEMAGVATLELRDGRAVELRRRKGNKDKVAIKLDGQPTDLDDAGWLRLLDHADRGLFESVFAFGLDQLSQGEASLKHESLQSALFGGSLGGTSSPDKVVAELTRQADELFKKGGSKPAINSLLAELKRLAKEIKDRSLRPEKYHEAEAAVTKAGEHAQRLHQQVDQLRREHSKIEKRARAWPKWNELQQRRGERAGLRPGAETTGVADAASVDSDAGSIRHEKALVSASTLSLRENIPADARQRYQTLSKELKSLADEQAKRTVEVEQAERGLAALKLDPGAVSYRAEIKSCLELRQSFIEAREQLPERQRLREAMRLLIDRELAELRPGWSHEDLRAFSVDVATRTAIDRLSDDHRERTTAHTKLTAQRDGDAANLERARDDLAEIGAPRDVTAIATVLADEADFVANRKQADSTRGELAKLERRLATQCRKLAPPLPAAPPAPHELPVPRTETVAEFETQFADLRERLRIERTSAEEDDAERREIDKTLATAMSSHVVPSLGERDAARERRDLGWKLVRQKHVAGEQVDAAIAAWLEGEAAPSLPDGYERAVRVADDIADQIYDNANEVAQREGLRRQLAALAMRLDQKRQRIVELERQQAELQTKWLALWQPCGFEPLDPDAMLGWLNDHEAACATLAQRDELTEELSRLGERITSFEQRLRAFCSPVAPPTGHAASKSAGDDIAVLLTSAKQSVDDAKDQQRRTGELQKEVRRLDKQLAKYDDELQTLAMRETAAHAEWQALLSRLNLPAGWDADLAREVIDKLSATRVRLDALPGEESRISAMQSRIEEFDQRVQSLCEALESGMLRDPPELAIEKLAEQVERAVEAQRKHDDLSQKLSAAREQWKSLNDRHRQQDSERVRLFALAAASTEPEFLEVVSRAEKVVRLDGEIGQLAREIELIRAGDDPDEFEASLVHSERSVLEGEQRDLGEQLRQQEQLKREADEAVGAARKELAQLDGSGAVAILTEELSRKRSLLAAEVDRYMPLVYARHLLNDAVSRFEKENQPEMIATVSRLLEQMTGGKYVKFDRSSGGKQNVLICRADGVERTPDQLSTGTREQLYLAIRLAYVLHYCQQNQPLPIVIDDVLVNFDEERTRQTLSALADVSKSAQVLFFTCHPHMVALAREAVPGLNPIELPGNQP
ncbi:MAG: AAA family ATPase [Planctomycetota bacterium]